MFSEKKVVLRRKKGLKIEYYMRFETIVTKFQKRCLSQFVDFLLTEKAEPKELCLLNFKPAVFSI